MSKNILKSLLSIAVVMLIAISAFADVEVPQDELAQETVYPVFDNSVSLKNRNIKDMSTFDIGVFGGLALTEPVSNTTKFGLAVNYHFTEIHSLAHLLKVQNYFLQTKAQVNVFL